MSTRDDLIYYLEYTPSPEDVMDAEAWQQENPGSNLSEWIDAMREIGAL